VFFAVDNTDFAEDTADGKDTTRGTITVVYQKDNATGEVWSALGREKAAALHVFHAFTGADNVGRFSGLGKTMWFQQYMKVDRKVISALMKLTEEGDVTQDVKDALAKFVCLLYCPKGIHITSIPDLRWHLFCKHLAESSKLPPTAGSLEQHIERVHVQARVWS